MTKIATRYHDRSITLGEKGGINNDRISIQNHANGTETYAWLSPESAKKLATLLLDQFDLTREFIQEHSHPEFDDIRVDLETNRWSGGVVKENEQVEFWRYHADRMGWDLDAFDAEFGPLIQEVPKPKTHREIWDETWEALPIGGKFHFSDHPEKTHVKISDKKYFHDGGHNGYGFTPKIEDQRPIFGSSYTIVPKQ